MSWPEYTDAQLNERAAASEAWRPGTRVRHTEHPAREGTVARLHPGSLKRPRPIGAWRATVDWDDGRSTIHPLPSLRRTGG